MGNDAQALMEVPSIPLIGLNVPNVKQPELGMTLNAIHAMASDGTTCENFEPVQI